MEENKNEFAGKVFGYCRVAPDGTYHGQKVVGVWQCHSCKTEWPVVAGADGKPQFVGADYPGCETQGCSY